MARHCGASRPRCCWAPSTLASGITFIGEFYTPPNIPYYRDRKFLRWRAASTMLFECRQIAAARTSRLEGMGLSGSMVANLDDRSYTGVVDVNRWFGNHFSSYVHTEIPHGSKDIGLRLRALRSGDIGGSPIPAMNSPEETGTCATAADSQHGMGNRSFYSRLLWIPGATILIALIFYSLGYLSLSRPAQHVFSIFIYSACISLRVSSVLPWISHSDLQAGSATLVLIQALSSGPDSGGRFSASAFIVCRLGIHDRDRLWEEYRTSYPSAS